VEDDDDEPKKPLGSNERDVRFGLGARGIARPFALCCPQRAPWRDLGAVYRRVGVGRTHPDSWAPSRFGSRTEMGWTPPGGCI